MAFKMKPPTLLIFRNGETRIAAYIFPHPQGLCFVDLWWDTPGQQPFHVLAGEVQSISGGSWRVGDVLVRDLDKNDAEWAEWQRWLDYREAGGAHLTDEMAYNAIRESGGLVEEAD